MASALIENLSAASALATTDLFYVKQAGARGVKATGTQLLALVGTAYVPLAGGTMTGALTINTGAATTLSADLSGYLRVGSVTTFEHKGLTAITGLLISSTSAFQFVRAYGFIDANAWASIGANSFGGTTGVGIAATSALQWSTVHAAAGAVGVSLWMDAAATLAQRNGTTQQTFRLYRSYTDASNYSRLALGWKTTTALLTAEGLGTGSDGNIAFNDAALATGATLGYIMVPSAAGVSTGVPADIPTGQTPIVFDSTNKKIGAYTGGAWVWTAELA